MKEIQEWLGHSTYNTTADIYSHLDFSSKRNVANISTNTFVDEEMQSTYEGRPEVFDNPKPRHLNKYKHRENTKTIDMQMEQTSPTLDEEIAELDKLIKMKEELLRKKIYKPTCSFCLTKMSTTPIFIKNCKFWIINGKKTDRNLGKMSTNIYQNSKN